MSGAISWIKQGSAPPNKSKKEDDGHKTPGKRGRTTKGSTRARATLTSTERRDFQIPESDALKDLLTLILKGQANLFQRTRILECAVTDCHHVPTICPLVEAGNGAYQGYLEFAKDNPGCGPPGPWVFGAILEILKGMDIGEVSKTWVKKKIAAMATSSCADYATEVPYCKLQVCFDDDYYKLTTVIIDTTDRLSFRLAMKNVTDTTHFTGPAPPSSMEDSVSKWIQALAKD